MKDKIQSKLKMLKYGSKRKAKPKTYLFLLFKKIIRYQLPQQFQLIKRQLHFKLIHEVLQIHQITALSYYGNI